MHILFVADGRSPITRRWLQTLQPLGWQISLISTFPCAPITGVRLAAVLPLAFARHAGSQAGGVAPPSNRKGVVSRIRPLATWLRHRFGPLTLSFYTRKYQQLIWQLNPDLVHALRIPFEGMLASATPAGIPLIISTWGNDLTLHAPASRRMSALTRRTLLRADALIADAVRDTRLAQSWGFDPAKPMLVVPGNGGLDLNEMQTTVKGIQHTDPPQIINPRGLRSYIRTDTFFQAIPLVLAKHPEVSFVCTSMHGQKEALDWVEKLGLRRNVTLLPLVSQQQLWKEFARSAISASISTHDGTPNTLLEAMALGCLPVCGDIESIREWVIPGENGLLVDPADPQALAEALINALEEVPFQKAAAVKNYNLVSEKAAIGNIRARIIDFYQLLIKPKL